MAQMIKISYFISFHLSQLAQLGKLTKQHAEKSQEILLLLSDTALHFDRFRTKGKDRGFFFECFKVSILTHLYHLDETRIEDFVLCVSFTFYILFFVGDLVPSNSVSTI